MFDPATSGVIVACLLFFFLTTGVHIGVALGLSGFIGIFITINERAAFAQLATVPFSTTNSFTLAVIPLFILMGSLATQAGLTTDLYRAAYNWLGKISGGLAMATTLASAAFGAACGSTIVNAAVFTKMAMPEMTKFGYDKRLSAGCIAASGTLASLIPPSILMIIYAVITEQSVARLLVAGLIAHGHRHARAIMDEADLARLVREQARPGDMVVCLGAGTISTWANNLPARLTEQAA